MNRHKQNYSNIGNSHTLNQDFENSGVAVLFSYYVYRILARPPILGICRLVCGTGFYGPLHHGVMAYPTCRCRNINVQVTALTFDLSDK